MVTNHIFCMAVIIYVDIRSSKQYVHMNAQFDAIMQLFDVVSKRLKAIDSDSLFQLHKLVQRL